MPNDLDPTTSRDAQEALSHALGNRVIMILPLESGRFAILSRGFQLHSIVDFIPTTEELRTLSKIFALRLASRKIEATVEITAHPSRTPNPISIPLNITI